METYELSSSDAAKIRTWTGKVAQNMRDLHPEVPQASVAKEWLDNITDKRPFALKRYLDFWSSLDLEPPMDSDQFDDKYQKSGQAEKLHHIKGSFLALFRKVAIDCEPSEIYATACTVFEEFSKIDLNSTLSTPVKRSTRNIPNSPGLIVAETVRRHWTTELVGDNLQNLMNTLEEYGQKFEEEGNYYSKVVLLIQSSGSGKSRLADAVGERCVMIPYVIRDHDGGYPAVDKEVLTFLLSQPSEDQKNVMSPQKKLGQQYDNAGERIANIWVHALMLGLLRATFEILNEHINIITRAWSLGPSDDSQLPQLASDIHRRMAPGPGTRSAFRIKFCNDVVKRARDVVRECIEEKMFRCCFDVTSGSEIRSTLQDSKCDAMKKLRTAIVDLEGNLLNLHKGSKTHPLCIVTFDEVASLLSEDGYNGRYIALNRMLSCISKGHQFWYLLLSTESKINDLLPPDSASHNSNMPAPYRPSSRGSLQLKCFPPFTQFSCDIPDLKNHCVLYPKKESMSAFTSIEFMARFGRPLWLAYSEAHSIASEKLLGGRLLKVLNTRHRKEVFAVLSNRLYLDFNMANPITLPLAQDAVNYYMRDVISVDPSTGIMFTQTPNEPILSYAAMRHLCSERWTWAQALETFTTELLDRGVVDKGQEGELFSRLILTLAHDKIVEPSITRGPFSSSNLIFRVGDFLRALYAESHHSKIDKIEHTILEANMNFLSFASTSEYITGKSFKHLCYSLLRRTSALQLAPQQRKYDQLLPFYFGDLNKPFDLEKVGAILVQVKNRKKCSNITTILQESFEPQHEYKLRYEYKRRSCDPILSENTETKVLFLLFDFGVDSSSVAVSSSRATEPTVWVIHSQGHNKEVFQCFKDITFGACVSRFFRNDPRNQFLAHRRCDPLHNFLHLDQMPQQDPNDDVFVEQPPMDVDMSG